MVLLIISSAFESRKSEDWNRTADREKDTTANGHLHRGYDTLESHQCLKLVRARMEGFATVLVCCHGQERRMRRALRDLKIG